MVSVNLPMHNSIRCLPVTALDTVDSLIATAVIYESLNYLYTLFYHKRERRKLCEIEKNLNLFLALKTILFSGYKNQCYC